MIPSYPPPHCHASAASSPEFFDSFTTNTGHWNLDVRENRRTIFSWGEPARLGLAAATPLGIGSEIFSQQNFGFGTYRFRLQFSSCDPSRGENLSNGAFLYFNDHQDRNQNGMEDNSEIDFEFACSEPQSLYLTSWTDYTDDAHFIKRTRRIDFATGEVWQTEEGQEGQYGLGQRWREARFQRPEIILNAHFYEMGFDWTTTGLRFFLQLPAGRLELWRLQGSHVIPQYPGHFRFNLRSTPEHWNTGAPALSPQGDSEMRIDCFSYDPRISRPVRP